MQKFTGSLLCCPRVRSKKSCNGTFTIEGDSSLDEVVYGQLICTVCKTRYPIYEGVAIVVPNVNDYLLSHVKGVSKFVADTHIPKEILKLYRKIRDEQNEEHIEEDLESDRVTSLYLMNHYLKASDLKTIDGAFIQKWVSEYWDHGPMDVISSWIPEDRSVVELGCGVGGLARRVRSKQFLGIDGSFQSILIARHLNLGVPYRGKLKMPGDLFQGPLEEPFSQAVDRSLHSSPTCDFIVGDLDSIPVKKASFDVAVAMNAIDMLDDPEVLPKTQKQLVKKNGHVIQCAPYIWAPRVSARLRKQLPRSIRDSASAIEFLYENLGLRIEKSEKTIPWLFYKHSRQIELYSVHAFLASVV